MYCTLGPIATDRVKCGRLAFGMVSRANEAQTAYCLSIVAQHCKYVFRVYEANDWKI
jgi:hypothetical protein